MRSWVWIVTGVLCASIAAAEESKEAVTKAEAEAKASAKAEANRAREQAMARSVPVRVQVVLTRQQGGKKLGSRPCSVVLNTNDMEGRPLGGGYNGRVFIGSQVPLRTSDKEGHPTVIYKDVGTKLSCQVREIGDGRYLVEASFDDSFVSTQDGPRDAADTILRVLVGSATFTLRDGGSAQFASAADPVTGDIVTADLTLNVLK